MKNLLSLNKLLVAFFLFCNLLLNAQKVANFVANGSFEDTININNFAIFPRFWSSLDTSNYYGELLRYPNKVPMNSYGYQWPKHGKNYLINSPYSIFFSNNRGYPRNRLKALLKPNHLYCVKFYVNLSHQSTHGIDALSAYFGDGNLDTITKCTIPITYLTPQIANPLNNVITDTLNWVAISGTFVAAGTEKYMVIGNFKSNANTNTILTNSINLPSNFADYNIDAVSCIEVDVAAYAGPDKYLLAGDSVYIGRERDFAVDPYCVWYQLPNTTSLDTTSGIWVKPTQTTTYVVQQNLECGSLKWDTVVVRVGYVGNDELRMLNDELKIYPNPANDFIELKIEDEKLNISETQIYIYNNLGQLIREEELEFKEGKATLNTKDLESGVYVVRVKSGSYRTVSKRMVIAR